MSRSSGPLKSGCRRWRRWPASSRRLARRGDSRMTRFSEILRLLDEGAGEFIAVGAVAAVAHGSVRFTQDVDVVYARNGLNLQRLVQALSCHEPALRGAPPGLPFHFDLDTVQAGLNFTLVTNL